MNAKLRWWVVSQLNRLPGQCWTDLVLWALGSDRALPWSPIGSACRTDLARTGACYCHKLRQQPEEGES